MDEHYFESCRKVFWQKVFQLEVGYLVAHLKTCRDILSVGCGPAIIEGELAKHGYNVTGLDISKEALHCAPDHIRSVAARAEELPFSGLCFDAAIYVASLQFVEDYEQAIEKTTVVLRPRGILLAMLLNPESEFFKRKLLDPDSYVRKIRHTDPRKIEKAIAERYDVRTEYFLGVQDETIFESRDIRTAVLYVILGRRRHLQRAQGDGYQKQES